MITIQELGLQILKGEPKKFYVFGGQEYGVKNKYIQKLSEKFGPIYECSSLIDTLSQMHRKQLVSMPSGVYIARYDEEFLSQLNDKSEAYISSANIPGVIVCLYENSKSVSKCDKYLPNNTAVIDQVDLKFIVRYLHEDFPKLDDRSISVAAKSSSSYGHAKCICSCMQYADPDALARLSEPELAALFGCNSYSDETEVKIGVGSKNFRKLLACAETYSEDLNRIIYTILQTMIEFDKIKSSKYSDSILRQFDNKWTREDVYYMFMHAFSELSKLRSLSSYRVEDSLIYLFSLITFSRIPSLEAMES